MTETWMDIPGYEGSYQVSGTGLVKSLPRVITHSNGFQQQLKGRILKHVYSKGYPFVNLFKDGKKTSLFIHRLVCEAFHGPAPEDKPWVLHWDDNPLNVNKDNLRWGTPGDNSRDATRNGVQSHHTKTRCPSDHPLEGANLVSSEKDKGWRKCRSCDQERAQSKRDSRPFDVTEADKRLERILRGEL